MSVDYILSQWYLKVNSCKIVRFLEQQESVELNIFINLFDLEIKIIQICRWPEAGNETEIYGMGTWFKCLNRFKYK